MASENNDLGLSNWTFKAFINLWGGFYDFMLNTLSSLPRLFDCGLRHMNSSLPWVENDHVCEIVL